MPRPSWLLNISTAGLSTTSLGKLCHCSDPLIVLRVFHSVKSVYLHVDGVPCISFCAYDLSCHWEEPGLFFLTPSLLVFPHIVEFPQDLSSPGSTISTVWASPHRRHWQRPSIIFTALFWMLSSMCILPLHQGTGNCTFHVSRRSVLTGSAWWFFCVAFKLYFRPR